MSSILLLTSSPRAESHSTRVAVELADALHGENPAERVVHRDLAADPLPHIDGLFAAAVKKPAEARSAEEVQAVKVSDALVAELLDAGTLIIATGLINFSIYSSLKTWIDHVARAGLTFKYTQNGPVGLTSVKKAYVVLASGGVYSKGPAAPMNHAVPYLEAILGFMGITDVETIYVEGLAIGPEAAQDALVAARSRIGALALAA